ncbi:hypothetical protein [uncultured Marinobacter sp.]|uniref:hypothetical protein n=1 Tax=uncultured Marinobacter sp. TaxID=187379 RepID=UPI0030D77257|tara:strand:- start:514 stop:1644 length:1131 start_codon:yes stop_codon:yes gene_type:complete
MVDMTYQTQYIREAPEIEARKKQILAESYRLYNEPMDLPFVESAGMSGTEQQAMDFAKQGVGSFEPYIQAASQGVSQGMDLTQRGALAAGAVDTTNQYQSAQDMLGRAAPVIGQGIGGILGSAQAYNPNQAASYMNPYQENVTQNALGEMQRQADIQRQGNAAQAVSAGAFGGTREGVQRAEFDRGVQDLMQQKIMQDYAQNYQQAQAAAMTGFEQQQGRQLAGGQALGQAGMQFGSLGEGIGGLTAQQAGVDLSKAQALGQLGGQMGQLGQQYGALGQATQQLGAADTALLAGLGGLERGIEQGQMDAIRTNQTQRAMAPYQQLGFLSDIFKGAPSTQMALTSQSAPSASPMQSAVGLGVGALTTGAAAKGLFGS